MMNRLLTRCLMFVVALASLPVVGVAQNETHDGEAELMTKRYADAYDSLLNSYYLRRQHHSRLHSNSTFSTEVFDAIPDSVISNRLAALHTVIPMTYNDEVRAYIRMYLLRMSTRLDATLTLCEYYHPMFEEALNRYGVPEELKYLTIVESAMNPRATSRVGAAGLWQFMYSTGKLYDLEVNSIIDERREPHKSTVAAARHLHDLYSVFNDWQLAIAAYNCGAGNINKAIARSGGKRGFWEIYPKLPRETRGYIPAFIAVVYVMNYYEQHGLHAQRLEIPTRSDTIQLRQGVLMGYVTEFVGVDADELHTLNPQYRVDYIPATESQPYPICLPTSKIELFIQMQDSIYAKTADSLSRKPVVVKPSALSRSSNVGKSGAKYYTVKKGDTLSSIARAHGISVSTLKKRNGLRGDTIRAGQKLKVR